MQVHIELEQCEEHELSAASGPQLYELKDSGYAAQAEMAISENLIDENEAGESVCRMGAMKMVQSR